MALPVGITTCTVTTGIPYDFCGDSEIKTTINAQPTLDLTWDATGDPILAFPMRAVGEAGMPVQLALPHVDQPGFSQAGAPTTHWGYRLTVMWSGPNGAKQRVINNFQPVVGQATVDLDLTADQVPVPASIGNIPFVTSVNGETGDVTVTGGTGGTDALTVVTANTTPDAGTVVGQLAGYWNASTASVTVAAVELPAGQAVVLMWDGTAWVQPSMLGGTVAPADTTPPTAGTLAVTAITASSALLTSTGAADADGALHALPYRFSIDAAVTWSPWQAEPTWTATPLTQASTYNPRCEVRNAEGLTAVAAAAAFITLTDQTAPLFSETFTHPDGTALSGLITETGGQAMNSSDQWISSGSIPGVVYGGKLTGGRIGVEPWAAGTTAHIRQQIDYQLVGGTGLRYFAFGGRQYFYQLRSDGTLYLNNGEALLASGVPTTGTMTIDRDATTMTVSIDGTVRDTRAVTPAKSTTCGIAIGGTDTSGVWAIDNWKVWVL